jgi:hypothetical protein
MKEQDFLLKKNSSKKKRRQLPEKEVFAIQQSNY